MEKILVIGANGFTGTEVIKLLQETPQYMPVAMIRDKRQKKKFDGLGVLSVVGDLEKDLTLIVKGIDRIIYAAGPEKLEHVEVVQNGTIALIRAAKEAKVQKFVMLSSMGVRNADYLPDFMKPVMEAKARAEEYLRQHFNNYTIVRPGELTFSDATHKVEAALQTTVGKIGRKDVARVLVEALSDEIAANKTFEIIEGKTYLPDALKEI